MKQKVISKEAFLNLQELVKSKETQVEGLILAAGLGFDVFYKLVDEFIWSNSRNYGCGLEYTLIYKDLSRPFLTFKLHQGKLYLIFYNYSKLKKETIFYGTQPNPEKMFIFNKRQRRKRGLGNLYKEERMQKVLKCINYYHQTYLNFLQE